MPLPAGPGHPPPSGPASAADRTGAGALRCWPSSRRSPACSPITSWRSGPAGSSTAGARTPAATAHKAARKHPAAKTTPAPPAAAHARAVVISVTAVSEPCWADLTTPGGATIFEGIVGTGTSKTWTERQAVTLKLGNPGAVTLTVDGKNRTGLGSEPLTLNLGPGRGNPG